jgi:hypothetical protein
MCRRGRSFDLGNDRRAPRTNACLLPISSGHDFAQFDAILAALDTYAA